jgi:Zn-dependent protease with chaperone function
MIRVARSVGEAEVMTGFAGVPIPVNGPSAPMFALQGELIWLALQLVIIALAAVLLFSGASARLRAALERLCAGRRYPVIVLVGWCWVIAATALTLPLRWLDHARWGVWGVPVGTWPAWLEQQLPPLIVQLIAVALLLWIPFALIRKAPRLWPVWLTLIVVPALAAGLVVFQVAVQPMLTSYRPLADPGLRAAIQSMAERCGAGPVPVFVGGDDVTVVGLGPWSRVLVSQSDLAAESRAELLTTMAHELKHYRMGDNWLAIAVVGGLILAGGLLVQLLGGAAIRAFGPRLGFASLADPAALPLMVLIATAAWSIAGLPIYNAVQRHAELEADRFALEVARDNRAQALWQASVGKQPWRMNEYDPVFRIWFANHPSQSERVRLADAWAPWKQGRPGVYDRVCRPPS